MSWIRFSLWLNAIENTEELDRVSKGLEHFISFLGLENTGNRDDPLRSILTVDAPVDFSLLPDSPEGTAAFFSFVQNGTLLTVLPGIASEEPQPTEKEQDEATPDGD